MYQTAKGDVPIPYQNTKIVPAEKIDRHDSANMYALNLNSSTPPPPVPQVNFKVIMYFKCIANTIVWIGRREKIFKSGAPN